MTVFCQYCVEKTHVICVNCRHILTIYRDEDVAQYRFQSVCFLLSLSSISTYASESWETGAYRLLEADYNGDGLADLIFDPTTTVRVTTTQTITVNHRTGREPMVMVNDSQGGYSLLRNADQSIIDRLSYKYADYKLIYGELTEDGLNDIVLQPKSDNGKLWLVQSEFKNQYTIDGYNSFELNSHSISYLSTSVEITDGKLVIGSNLQGLSPVPIQKIEKRVVLGDNQIWVEAIRTTSSSNNNYRILWIDYNNDGKSDILFDPTTFAISQAGTVSTIVPISTGYERVVLLNDGDGGFTLVRNANEVPLKASTTSIADYKLIEGDLSGDAKNDFVLQPGSDYGRLIVVQSEWSTAAAATVYTAGQLDFNRFGADTIDLHIANGQLFSYSEQFSQSTVTTTITDNTVHLGRYKTYSSTAQRIPGTIDGKAEVDVSGAARYRIPLEVAAGINGLKPSLSLSYNSNRGRGILGKGWAISGISSITRCQSNLADDDKIRAVNLDDQDRFCLDGQKLKVVSGTYGSVNSEYRTLINNFEKVVFKGEHWVVYEKNGNQRVYGATAHARVSAEETIVKWAISQKRDAANNTIDFDYLPDTKESTFVPITIRYANKSIQFKYEQVAATSVGYMAGSGVRWTNKNRLQSIKMLGADNASNAQKVFRTYHFRYEKGSFDNEDLLASIELCGRDKECFVPTQFNYESGEKEALAAYHNGQGASFANIKSKTLTSKGYRYFPNVDLNGDGYKDILLISRYVNSQTATTYSWYGKKAGGFTYKGTQGVTGSYSGRTSTYEVFDANGDGKDDIVVIRQVGKAKTYSWLSNGSGKFSLVSSHNEIGSTSGRYYRTFDANGDGLKDIIEFYAKGSGRAATIWKSNRNGTFSYFKNTTYVGRKNSRDDRPMDVNGDGILDIVYLDKADDNVEAVTYKNTNGKFSHSGTTRIGKKDSKYLQADLNGDGLTDFLVISKSGSSAKAKSWLNDGKGKFIAVFDISSVGGWSDRQYFTTDINRDGSQDLVEIYKCDKNRCLTTWINNGVGYFNWHKGGKSLSNYARYYGVDSNGNGSLDVVGIKELSSKVREGTGEDREWVNHYYPQFKTWQTQSDINLNKLASITDGLRNETHFDYTSMVHNTVYKKSGNKTTFPVLPAIAPRYLVSEMKQSDGIGGENTFSYRYEGLISHLQGIGSLGFKKRQISDHTNKRATVIEYSQDWQNRTYGAPLLERTCIEGSETLFSYTGFDYCGEGKGQKIKEVTTTWGTNKSSSGVYAYHPASKVTSLWDQNGNEISAQKTDEESYDFTHGLATKETLTTGKGFNGTNITDSVQTEQRDWSYHITSSWLIKPATLKTTVDITGNTDARTVNTTNWSYNSTGLLERVINEPNTSEEFITEYRNFDRGLPKTIEERWKANGTANAGLDFTSRTEKRTYDVNGYLATQTNALGHKESFEYDGSLGKLNKYENANGQETHYKYNGVGFLSQLIEPATTTDFIYQFCASGCYDNMSYSATKTTQGQPTSQTFYDAFGRERLTRTKLLSGKWRYTKQSYNAHGLTESKSVPYLEGNEPALHEYEYDLLGKVTLHNKPKSTASTEYQYEGARVTRTEHFNGKSLTTIEEHNALGQKTAVNDALGSTIRYQYNGLGLLTKTTNVDGSEIKIDYNRSGHRTKLDDPDKGVINYTVNALGLVAKESLSGATNQFTFDKLGRMITRTTSEGVASWQYDQGNNAKGLVSSVNQGSYSETYDYDALSRLHSKSVTYGDGQTARQSWQYGLYNRLDTVTYPGNYGITYQYNDYGYLKQIHRAGDTSDVHWQALSMDAWGNVDQYLLDGSLKTVKQFDKASGLVNNIQTSWFGFASTKVQDAQYQYDDIGNLTTRTQSTWSDSSHGYQQTQNETYTYDKLHRLSAWTDQAGSHTMQYAANGNILNKPGIGSYRYGQQESGCSALPGPHAVSWTQSKGNLCYDGRGNMISGGGKTLTYTSFDKPKVMIQGGSRIEVAYGPDLSRYKRTDKKDGKVATTTWYMGHEFERELSANGKLTERLYLGDFGFVERIKKAGQSDVYEQTRYLLKDHIGSIIGIAEGNGYVLLSQFTYDPWGKRSQVYHDFENKDLLDFTQIGRLGFTGHEMLDPVGLIHMNGRVYDPELARFVTPDPVVSDPYDTQAFNRYSYVHNRPTSFTDPTGYFIPALIGIVRVAVIAAPYAVKLYKVSKKALSTLRKQAQKPKKPDSKTGGKNNEASKPEDGPKQPSKSESASKNETPEKNQKSLEDKSKGNGDNGVEGKDGGEGRGGVGKKVTTQFEKKIENQMGKRGWDKDSVNSTIDNPNKTVSTRDTRWNSDGTRRDDPATAYIREDDHYVVRNNNDGTIVQISNRNKADWKSPFE